MIAVELKNSHKMIGNIYMGKRDFEALEIGYVLIEITGDKVMPPKAAGL